MNYKKVYKQLISKYQKLNLQKGGEIYLESHHIIPKCMSGTNKKSNLVNLPAKAHFIAHHLLVKIYNNNNLWYAFQIMCNKINPNLKRDYIITARMFNELKRNIDRTPHNKGKIGLYHHTDEHKQKMSKLFTGRNLTEESKQKISISRKGSKLTKETKEKISTAMIKRAETWDYKHTEQKKKELSEIALKRFQDGYVPNFLDKKHSLETKEKMKKAWENRPIFICPYCNREFKNVYAFNNFHGDNCKLNPKNITSS